MSCSKAKRWFMYRSNLRCLGILALSCCMATPAIAQRESFTSASGRRYELYAGASRNQPAALLVALHGCLQSPAELARGTRFDELAKARSFIVVYPEQAVTANPARCWNWFLPAQQQRSGSEPAQIAEIAREVMARFNVDSTRIYISGMSAGGAMAVIVAAQYSDLFAAVAAHAAVPFGAATDVSTAFALMKRGDPAGPELPSSTRPIPGLFAHGAADTIVAVRNHAALIEQWRKLHARAGELRSNTTVMASTTGARAFTQTRMSDRGGRVVIESILVDDLPHAWPGGDAAVSYMDSTGPSLSTLVMDFLLQHRRIH